MDFNSILLHHLGDSTVLGLGAAFGFTKHMLMILIAAALAAASVILAANSRGGLRTALEALVEFIRDDIAVPAMGEEDARAYLPYFLTLFTFILFMNLLGLVPFGASATGNLSVTASLAILTLLLIHASGIRRHGLFRHFANLIPHGVPWWIAPLVFAIEVLGYFAKTAALCIRLMANMTAGHLVIIIVLGLILLFGSSNPWAGLAVAPVSVGIALGLYALELIVALIQAYVFTILTAVFVGAALHPEH